ncbi:MAG: hypothetical protein J6Q24_05695 [Clostridia bacterium]|nr:hypothetical protein [Clostridia bacterium]
MVARVWEPSPLIAALPDKGFIDYTELFVPFLLILPISFLLYDNFEIELGLVCGVKTAKLMLYKFFSILIYTLIPMGILVVFYKYEEYFPTVRQRYGFQFIFPRTTSCIWQFRRL